MSEITLRCPFNDCPETPTSADDGWEMSGFCCSNEDHYFQVNIRQLQGGEE